MNTSTCSRLKTSRDDQPVVAHVVDEQAVRGVEAAHVEHVAGGARGAAAFAGLQRDAGHVAQRLAQRGDALRLHRRARDDLDRLRDVATSGVAYFGDSTRGSRPVTCKDSRTPCTSMTTLPLACGVAARAVPVEHRGQRAGDAEGARHARRLHHAERYRQALDDHRDPGRRLEGAHRGVERPGGDVEADERRRPAGGGRGGAARRPACRRAPPR